MKERNFHTGNLIKRFDKSTLPILWKETLPKILATKNIQQIPWAFFVPRIDLTQETLLTIWAVGGVELIEAPSSGTEYKQCLLLLPTLWLHLLFCCVDITYVRTCVMYPAPLQSDAHTFCLLGFYNSGRLWVEPNCFCNAWSDLCMIYPFCHLFVDSVLNNSISVCILMLYPSVLDFWKIKLEKWSSTNWIFSLFRTGFLPPV